MRMTILRKSYAIVIGIFFMAVMGLPAAVFAETDVSDKVQLIQSRLLFDRLTSQNYLDVSVKNISNEVLLTPIKIVIDSISTPDVTVANADGVTSEGKPYFEYMTNTGQFLSGETTGSKRIKFNNPKVARFTFTKTVYATIPEAAAVIGPEGGKIEVINAESPLQGMSIDFLPGSISENCTVTIDLVNNVQLNNKNSLIGPVVSVKTTQQIAGYAHVRLPITGQLTEGDIPIVYTEDENGGWDVIPTAYIENGYLEYETTHFSFQYPAKVKFDPNIHENGMWKLLLFNMYKSVGFPNFQRMEGNLVDLIYSTLDYQRFENATTNLARTVIGTYKQTINPNPIGLLSTLNSAKGYNDDVTRSAYDDEDLKEGWGGLFLCSVSGFVSGGPAGVMASCTDTVMFSVFDMVTRFAAAIVTNGDLKKINNINIANDYLTLHYMYGEDLALLVQQEDLDLNNQALQETNVIEAIAKTYKKGIFSFDDYDLDEIADLISKTKLWMDEIAKGLDSDKDGILDDGNGSGINGDAPCNGGETKNCDDNCPDRFNPNQADSDGDGVGDVCDNCLNTPENAVVDSSGCSDAQIDHDGDGYSVSAGDCNDADNTIHPGATEICNDGIDQDCDGYDLICISDSDGDGHLDGSDNCPYRYNPNQADFDGDGAGDVCDDDDDNDGVMDVVDALPFNPSEWADTDGDGIGDNSDTTDNSIPTNVKAEYQPGNSWNYIRWDAVPGASEYRVYWGTEPFVTNTSELLTPTNTTEYGHTGVVTGYTYYYRVAAVVVGIETELSEQVSAYVGAGKIPDTGQTTSYTNTFGEDSDYNINPQSYTKLDANGNNLPDSATVWAMVRDNVTGLIWENKTNDGGIHDKDNYYTWYNAQSVFITQLNNENYGGHSDWRLPTVMELSMLVHADKLNPAINTTYFQNTMSSYYWSSTTHASSPGLACYVAFLDGHVNYPDKSTNYYVRAVRGGQ